MSIGLVMRGLEKQALSGELDILYRLAIAAGYMWRCPRDGCRTANHDDRGACANCGDPQPPNRPKPRK